MHKKLFSCYWLRCFFVASIFDHYSFVYRMCLTLEEKKIRHYSSSSRKALLNPRKENHKIPWRLKPPENLINLICFCLVFVFMFTSFKCFVTIVLSRGLLGRFPPRELLRLCDSRFKNHALDT